MVTSLRGQVTSNAGDPLEELNIRKEQAKGVTAVHLGERAIPAIHPNFQLFVTLEQLWLSSNKIKRIENLFPEDYGNNDGDIADRCHGHGCVRLRELYLANNRITTLSGDLRHLKFLEVLLLANNSLTNMELVSTFLRHLNFLRQLDLFGNPLTEEHDYRLYFIFHHPTVQTLDRKSVEDSERDEARGQFGITSGSKMNRLLQSKEATKKPVIPDKTPAISASVKDLERRIAERARRKQAEEASEKRRISEEQRRKAEEDSRLEVPEADNSEVVMETLIAREKGRAAEARIVKRTALLRILVRDSEMQTIRYNFQTGQGLTRVDCRSILELLGLQPAECDEMQPMIDGWLAEYQDVTRTNSVYTDPTEGEGGDPSADSETEEEPKVSKPTKKVFDVMRFLERLIDALPVAKRRSESLRELAMQSIIKGRDSEAQGHHRDLNLLEDHIRELEQGLPS